ncbi:MAG: hypothetical protein AAFU74_13080, partial [Bacteroidota bacterium]
MNEFIKKKHYVGVDISNATLDLALMKKNGFGEFRTDNSLKGFSLIPKWIGEQGLELDDCAFCMEHTGTYGLLF